VPSKGKEVGLVEINNYRENPYCPECAQNIEETDVKCSRCGRAWSVYPDGRRYWIYEDEAGRTELVDTLDGRRVFIWPDGTETDNS